MFDIYFLASSILGGVLLTLFANAASVKLPSVLRRLVDIFTSGAVSMPYCDVDSILNPLLQSAVRAVFSGEPDYSGKPLTR